MSSIRFRSHVGSDGILNIRVPVALTERDVEGLVIIQDASTQIEQGAWPNGYFESTYGSFEDDPLMRDEQGQFESREDLA